MEGQQEIARALAPYGFGKLKHERRLHSSVTTSWGVDWDEEMIARDLMQNFFDADRERIAQVKVEVNGSGATISAPTPYNLERLYYLGSEKGAADVGQYGEGFKAAAVSLFRKYPHAVLAAASGDQVLWIHVDETPIQATEMRPLVYDFFRTPSPVPGNRLVVGGAAPRLAQALQHGLTHFLYPGNPLLGPELAKDWKRDFLVYRATTSDGHIFYRSMKRGDIPDIPLVLVLNKPYKRIEQKVASDRDRKAFGDELRQLFYQHFAQYFFNQWDRQRIAVEAARPLWEAGSGHPLLARIAEHTGANPWGDKTAAAVFGDRFFARSHSTRADEQLRYLQTEETWTREGRTALPGYFNRFGVISADRHFRELELKARREAQEKAHRPVSPAEIGCIDVLRQSLNEFDPDLMRFFDRRRAVYSVANTEVLLGELRSQRVYRSYDVFLAEDLFEADFARALAVFVHEHAHIFAHDGSRVFTDELTGLLENVVRARQGLDRCEKAWHTARQAVLAERRAPERKPADDLDRTVASLREGELREVVKRLPTALLRQLLKERR